MAVYYTYLYRDPKDGRPIYVGKGKGRRAIWHFRNNKTRLSNLIRKRLSEGYEVKPIIHYEVDEETAFIMEKFWIDFYGREDLGKGTLFNLTDGGEGYAGAVRSEKIKKQVADKLRGRKMTQEQKDKISAANKGRKLPPPSQETRNKLSAVWKGRKRTPEHNEKMRQSLIGRYIPPMTEEHKKKISDIQKAIWAKRKEQKKDQT